MGSVTCIIYLGVRTESERSLYFNTMVIISHYCNINNIIIFIIANTFLIIKAPIIYIHYWLLKAHVRSYGVCSIVLAGLILKMRGVGIINIRSIFRPKIR